MKVKKRIEAAIVATRRLVPGYFEKTLAQRAGASGQAAGSIYPDLGEAELEAAILAADWQLYEHPSIMEGCTGFQAPLPGLLGIVELSSLPGDTTIVLDDRKNTGKVSATVEGIRGEKVPFTVLILGPEQGEEIVFTFHPGEPVRPSQVTTELGLHGKKVTTSEALGIGLEIAKIV